MYERFVCVDSASLGPLVMASAVLINFLVKPLWAFRMRTSSPSCDDGMDEMVAGCESWNPSRGSDRRICDPGFQLRIFRAVIRTLVAPPSRGSTVARAGRELI